MEEKVKLDKETLAEEMYRTHAAVQKAFTFNSHFVEYEKIKIERTVSFTKAGNTKQLELAGESFTNSAIQFFPESAEYLFHVEGIAKKLFLFLLVHYVSPRTNLFLFNAQVVADFNSYNALLGGKPASESNISQGLRKLVKSNIMQNVERGKYMLNPLIAGGMSLNGRRTLIQEYSQLLISKGKDAILDFYPNGNSGKTNFQTMAPKLALLKAISFRDNILKDELKMRVWIFAEIKSNKKQTETGKTAERICFGDQIDFAKLEQVFIGKIEEYRTTPYKKAGKKYESISVVVFSDENGLDIAAKELYYFKAYPYDKEGNVYKPKNRLY